MPRWNPDVADERAYPVRPFLAVSAAIFREGKLLLVRRARPPAHDLFTLPGGVVESGETLTGAVIREVREETALTIAPVALAGYSEVIVREVGGRVARHFVVLPFAARWVEGELEPNEEIAEARWVAPEAVGSFRTTEGLAEIIESAVSLIGRAG